jgi:hypothetical protein
VIDRWKLYYDDGRTFSSEDGTWNDAPPDGILIVNYWEGGVKHTLAGHDYYYLKDEAMAETDDLGPFLRLLRVVKFGRWTSHAKMEAACRAAREDP